jgi:hypothetical protein
MIEKQLPNVMLERVPAAPGENKMSVFRESARRKQEHPLFETAFREAFC